jgi:hypothetical protein
VKRVGNKAREMIIKMKSKGKDSIPAVDRFYVSASFPRSTRRSEEELYLFFGGRTSVGCVCAEIGDAFPQLGFNSGVKSDGMSLVLTTDTITDWRDIDRNMPLSGYCEQFDSIRIWPVATADVVMNQSAQDKEKQTQTSTSTSKASLENGLAYAGGGMCEVVQTTSQSSAVTEVSVPSSGMETLSISLSTPSGGSAINIVECFSFSVAHGKPSPFQPNHMISVAPL